MAVLVGVALVGALVAVVVTDMVAIVGVVIVVEVEIEFFPLPILYCIPQASTRSN